MSFNSLSSIRLFDVSTYLVEQMQRFFPNEALDRVNSKIELIRSGIAGMSSSAISLYSSNPDSSSISGPVKVIGINRLMQGVDEAQIHVPGEATYKFPIFSSTCSLYGHAELLYIGEIKEYILNQEKFTTRSEAIQLIISGLLISNYACRILGIIVTPLLFISAAILGVKLPKIFGWAYLFMFFHGFMLGPKLREWIEYMSQPTSSNATVEVEKADAAIRQIEECELTLIKIIYQNTHEFTKEGLQKLLETRRMQIDLLETFLNYASSQVDQQNVLWNIKARLNEPNW
jgi:hypothetical protein